MNAIKAIGSLSLAYILAFGSDVNHPPAKASGLLVSAIDC